VKVDKRWIDACYFLAIARRVPLIIDEKTDGLRIFPAVWCGQFNVEVCHGADFVVDLPSSGGVETC